jgi:hypothetical protein
MNLRPYRRSALGALALAPLAATLALAVPSPAFAAPAPVAATTSTGASTGAPTAAASSGTASSGTASSGTASSPLCTPSTLAQAKATVETELANRVTQLDTLVSRVNSASGLAPSDKATLLADLTGTELPGIEALQPKVPNDTTCAQVRMDAHSMVYQFRVYLVMTPQTDLVIANDAGIAAGGVLAGLEPTISGRISYTQSHGKGFGDAQVDFADYQAKVTAAQSLVTTGQSATLLAQTPAGCPGNASVFLEARTNLTNAHLDLHAARDDLAKIINDLS